MAPLPPVPPAAAASAGLATVVGFEATLLMTVLAGFFLVWLRSLDFVMNSWNSC